MNNAIVANMSEIVWKKKRFSAQKMFWKTLEFEFWWTKITSFEGRPNINIWVEEKLWIH